MTRARALGPIAAAWLAFAAPSCAGTDVTLATLPVGDDAGEAGGPLPCGSINDCPSGSYCDKPTCDAPSGTCQLYPSQCPNDEQPYCGCDGITYFHDCLRRESGIASSTRGPCWLASATTCGGPGKFACPQGAVCAQLLGRGPGPCPSDAEGSCWVLPPQCPPPAPGADEWDSCQPGDQCVDTCTALRNGGPYKRSMMCH